MRGSSRGSIGEGSDQNKASLQGRGSSQKKGPGKPTGRTWFLDLRGARGWIRRSLKGLERRTIERAGWGKVSGRSRSRLAGGGTLCDLVEWGFLQRKSI